MFFILFCRVSFVIFIISKKKYIVFDQIKTKSSLVSTTF